MHMYNFLCSDSLLYFFLFLSTLHSVYTRDCSYKSTPFFIARSAVCSQMYCTFCLSNDIQTPDQVNVPCTTPYFHKDTLTPPSSSRSLPLEGGGPSTHAARDASLYITQALYFEIYTQPLEGIQLLSIAGYEAFICVCFFVYKTLCTALHMANMGRP